MTVKHVRRNDSKIEITLDDEKKILSDEILVATGRTPNTQDVGLETIGIASGGWLEVDDTCLVKGVPGEWLYAVGDVNRRALLTHMGKYEARACVAAVLERIRGPIRKDENGSWSKWTANGNLAIIPQVIFTDPQVAAVGLTEASARSLGINVKVADCELEAIDGARLHSDGYKGHARIVVDASRGVIVGATLIGSQVGEMIHAATIAVVGEVPLDRLWHAVPSFPTIAEVWTRLLEGYGL